MGEDFVKYITVWIDDANKKAGCPFVVRFRPVFALQLSQFNINQHKLSTITLK
jgi:hypothetical protein